MTERESTHEFPGVDGPKPPSQVRTRTPNEEEPGMMPTTGWQTYYRRLKPLLGYLPLGTHESDTEYDGLLSYSVEVHAAVIGIAAGSFAATTGNSQAVMGLVAVALGIGRMQQPQKVREQIKREPWYFLATFGITYILLTKEIIPIA